jgi:hypothetical protein
MSMKPTDSALRELLDLECQDMHRITSISSFMAQIKTANNTDEGLSGAQYATVFGGMEELLAQQQVLIARLGGGGNAAEDYASQLPRLLPLITRYIDQLHPALGLLRELQTKYVARELFVACERAYLERMQGPSKKGEIDSSVAAAYAADLVTVGNLHSNLRLPVDPLNSSDPLGWMLLLPLLQLGVRGQVSCMRSPPPYSLSLLTACSSFPVWTHALSQHRPLNNPVLATLSLL